MNVAFFNSFSQAILNSPIARSVVLPKAETLIVLQNVQFSPYHYHHKEGEEKKRRNHFLFPFLFVTNCKPQSHNFSLIINNNMQFKTKKPSC
jgi:D-lyxose ketol-isomerase